MSSYYTRYCEKHGEWEQDIDHPHEECPDCEALGIAPSQLIAKELSDLRAECERLRAENARLREICTVFRRVFDDRDECKCDPCTAARAWDEEVG